MNAEDAYEMHTHLARALATDPGERELLTALARSTNRDGHTGRPAKMFWLGDRDLNLALGRQPRVENIVVDWSPLSADDPTGDADTDAIAAIDDAVGVIDPEMVLNPNPGANPDSPAALLVPYDVWADITASGISRGTTFYVTADMCDVMEHAAHAMDDTDFMPEHPRFRSGVAVLAKPLALPFGDGVTTQWVRAFSWTFYGQVRTSFGGLGHAGLVIQWADRVTHPDEIDVVASRLRWSTVPGASAWSKSPRLVPQIIDRFITGTPVGRAVEMPDDVQGRVERTRAAFGGRVAEPEPIPDGAMGRFQPYLAAFLMLLSQPITETHHAAVSEYAAKRGRKAYEGRKLNVSVIDVRRRPLRAEGDNPETESRTGTPGRKLKNRHLVAGHWHWQPYGPQRRLRKRIYVSGYIKGPEGAPLVIKPRVRRVGA